MGDSDDYLFDPTILHGWDDNLKKLIENSNLTLRPLKISDYDLGYCELLAQLTTVGDLGKAAFEGKVCFTMRSAANLYNLIYRAIQADEKV